MRKVRRSSVKRDTAARAASFSDVGDMCAAAIGAGGPVIDELSESAECVNVVEHEDGPDGLPELEVASNPATGTKLPLNLESKMLLCANFSISHTADLRSGHVLPVSLPPLTQCYRSVAVHCLGKQTNMTQLTYPRPQPHARNLPLPDTFHHCDPATPWDEIHPCSLPIVSLQLSAVLLGSSAVKLPQFFAR